MSDQITPPTASVPLRFVTDPRAVSILAAIYQEEGFFTVKNLARRNRNPGNLRGLMGLPGSTVDGYAKFATMQAGHAAAAKLFDEYRAKGATLEAFLSAWAPPSENDTEAYIRLVESLTGIARTERI